MNVRLQYSSIIDSLKEAIGVLLNVTTVHTVRTPLLSLSLSASLASLCSLSLSLSVVSLSLLLRSHAQSLTALQVVVHNPAQLTETFVRFEYERSKGLQALHVKQKQLKAVASAAVVRLSNSQTNLRPADAASLRSPSPVQH